MSNKAKLLIAIGAVLLIALIISVFYFAQNKKPATSGVTQNQSSSTKPAVDHGPPPTYQVNIAATSQAFSGTIAVDGKNVVLAAKDFDRYANVTLNSTGDLLWVLCPPNYNLSNTHGSSGDTITNVPGVGANMTISATGQNTFSATCTKQ